MSRLAWLTCHATLPVLLDYEAVFIIYDEAIGALTPFDGFRAEPDGKARSTRGPRRSFEDPSPRLFSPASPAPTRAPHEGSGPSRGSLISPRGWGSIRHVHASDAHIRGAATIIRQLARRTDSSRSESPGKRPQPPRDRLDLLPQEAGPTERRHPESPCESTHPGSAGTAWQGLRRATLRVVRRQRGTRCAHAALLPWCPGRGWEMKSVAAWPDKMLEGSSGTRDEGASGTPDAPH